MRIVSDVTDEQSAPTSHRAIKPSRSEPPRLGLPARAKPNDDYIQTPQGYRRRAVAAGQPPRMKINVSEDEDEGQPRQTEAGQLSKAAGQGSHGNWQGSHGSPSRLRHPAGQPQQPRSPRREGPKRLGEGLGKAGTDRFCTTSKSL